MTSHAIRKAARPSKKKARKLERKGGFARRRAEEALEEAGGRGEVEMRDLEGGRKGRKGREEGEGEGMQVDGVK